MAIGVDIEDISRFKDKPQKFLDRLFTKKEQEYCLSKTEPEKHFAARFCAKEATFKALCALGIKQADFRKIEVVHSENGCPEIVLLENQNNLTIEASLSHDKTKAIAFVVINKN